MGAHRPCLARNNALALRPGRPLTLEAGQATPHVLQRGPRDVRHRPARLRQQPVQQQQLLAGQPAQLLAVGERGHAAVLGRRCEVSMLGARSRQARRQRSTSQSARQLRSSSPGQCGQAAPQALKVPGGQGAAKQLAREGVADCGRPGRAAVGRHTAAAAPCMSLLSAPLGAPASLTSRPSVVLSSRYKGGKLQVGAIGVICHQLAHPLLRLAPVNFHRQ